MNDQLSPPRIVCAAIRAADGDVLIGIRHYSPDMHRQIEARIGGSKFKHRNGQDQGFVDQHGKYYTRAEAMDVTQRNGQLPDMPGQVLLYSEDLY